MTFVRTLSCTLLAAAFASAAAAQQSTDMPAAVQPGYEITVLREEATVAGYDDDRPGGADFTQVTARTTLAYGLSPTVAAMLHVPVVHRAFDGTPADADDEGTGLADVTVMLQWRVLQRDTGAINTQRLVLLAGAELPTFDEGFSSESVDPLLGVAFTAIHGRHGFNASVLYMFTTGQAGTSLTFGDALSDAVKLDGSYLYRLAPDRYTADSWGAHYVQVQTLGRYETNGDLEVHLAPGWMYEAPGWAAEATVHVPLWQDVDERAEMDWAVNVGVRLLF